MRREFPNLCQLLPVLSIGLDDLYQMRLEEIIEKNYDLSIGVTANDADTLTNP